MLDATKTGSGGNSRLEIGVLVRAMMRRIKSLRDAEDVVTLLLQLLVIGRRRPARKGQVHIIQFSPTTTISFYCKLQKHGVLMVLCRASLPLLSCGTAAAVTAYAGRNPPARPVAGAVAHAVQLQWLCWWLLPSSC